MGDAGGPGMFVAGAHLIEEVHRHVGNGVVLLDNHLHAVRQGLRPDVLLGQQQRGKYQCRENRSHRSRIAPRCYIENAPWAASASFPTRWPTKSPPVKWWSVPPPWSRSCSKIPSTPAPAPPEELR